MEPTGIIGSLPHLVKAYEAIDAKLKEAQALTKDDAKYYIA